MSWRRGITFGDMAVGLLCVAFAVRAALMPAVSDTFWHLRAGADIWRTGQVSLRRQLFVHGGGPAVARPRMVVASIRRLRATAWGGCLSPPLAGARCSCLRCGVVHRLMVGPPAARFVLLADRAVDVVDRVWVLRPHIVTLLAVPVLALLLVRERFWPIPLLFLAWANAHGGVVAGRVWCSAAATGGRLAALARASARPRTGVACWRWRWCCRCPGWRAMRRRSVRASLHFIWESTVAHPRRRHRRMATRPARPRRSRALFWAAALAFLVLAIRRRRAFIAATATLASWADWVARRPAHSRCCRWRSRSVRNIAPFLLFADHRPRAACWAPLRRLPTRVAAAAARPTSADHPRAQPGACSPVFAGRALALVALAYRGEAKRLGWHARSATGARGDPQLRRPALQPLQRGRLPHLVRARAARVRRQPPGSLSAAVPARFPRGRARADAVPRRCSSAGGSAACSSPTTRRPSRRCAATAG